MTSFSTTKEDDSEEGRKALAPGTRWLKGLWAGGLGRLVVLEELVLEDLNIPPDVRTMKLGVHQHGEHYQPRYKTYWRSGFLKSAIMQSHDCAKYLRICAIF